VQRRDEDLIEQGKVIGATFDRVFLCEDQSVKRELPETEGARCSRRACTKAAA
jgi:cyanophycin synthetase